MAGHRGEAAGTRKMPRGPRPPAPWPAEAEFPEARPILCASCEPYERLPGLHRPGEPLEQNAEKERRQAEQKPQDVETPRADHEVDRGHQGEKLQDVLDDEPLSDAPFQREGFP